MPYQSLPGCSSGHALAAETSSQGRLLKDVVAQQTASTSMSGTTGGSSSSTVQLQLSGGTITAAGVASTSTEGDGTTSSVVSTSGFVKQSDGTYVANAAYGQDGAQGNGFSADNQAWGFSDTGPLGPGALAGHTVDTQGPFTGSTGDQAVGILTEQP